MKDKTKIITAGSNPKKYGGTLSAPIYQSSTLVFNNFSEFQNSPEPYSRVATETTHALARTITELENGYDSIISPSGLGAISFTLLSLLKSGDHIVVTNSAYGPTKNLCNNHLKDFGITTSYYNSDSEIENLIQENTKVIFLESPGSLIFPIQDIEKITLLAKNKNIITVIDNTWGASHFLKPLNYGVDITLQSCSKYHGGHSDVMLGSVTCKEQEIFNILWNSHIKLGFRASPYDCSLVNRGIRTLGARLDKHYENALTIAKYLEKNKAIKQIIYPALTSHPQHDLWKKYFTGANGLISFVVDNNPTKKQIIKFVDQLKLFKIGYSWGGYESLIMFYDNLPAKGEFLIRLHVGLEDINDLTADLERSLSCLQ